MTIHVERTRVIDALEEEWSVLDELLGQLTPQDWTRPSSLAGWDVQALVAHIIGTESMLVGIDPPVGPIDPADYPHVRNDIGAFNEQWIIALAGRSPTEMRSQLSEITATRRAALADMDAEAWSTEGFTPAGMDTYGRFMRIRLFDTWLHEQDIRDAVGRPGHESGAPVELTLDEMANAMGYAVGKLAGAPRGSSVTFELTGPAGRRIHVAVRDRAAVVESLDEPATVLIRLPVGDWVRVAGGRVRYADVAADVDFEGDHALGRQVLEHLAYTI